MKKIFNENKAITLVALVITIIILLILAGISIVALSGSKLFENAQYATERTKNAQALEEMKLIVMNVQLNRNGQATLQDLVNYMQKDEENDYIISLTKDSNLQGNIPNIENVTEIYVIYKGYQFRIDNNLNIENIGEITQKLTDTIPPEASIELEKSDYLFSIKANVR